MKPSHVAAIETVPMGFELEASVVHGDSWSRPLCCPACQVPLNLHQPDEEQPAQLLGTCDDCGRWFFLVESEVEWEGTLMFALPSAETIRATLARQASN
jgi:hypothetical protein